MKQVYIVRHKSGTGWYFKVNASSEYSAKTKVATDQHKSPDDYFAYLF